MLLLVVSGLPGTGKSTLAEALAVRLEAAHVSVDPIEEALRACGLPGSTTGVAAYEAARAAAETSLAAGRDVVVDAVNDSEAARDTWRRAADATGARLRWTVLALSDPSLHRARLEGRSRPFRRIVEPTWAEVAARRVAPWRGEVLLLDAAAPVEQLVATVLADVG